jgi:purine-binding chemotaxis protein CheW
MCVIVESQTGVAGEPYALLVDEVGDVLMLPASEYEPNPITLAPAWRRLCRGLYRRDGALLILLDVEAVLELGAAAA